MIENPNAWSQSSLSRVQKFLESQAHESCLDEYSTYGFLAGGKEEDKYITNSVNFIITIL